MKNLKKLYLGLALMLVLPVAVLLGACGGDAKVNNSIVGTWENTTVGEGYTSTTVLKINANGTFEQTGTVVVAAPSVDVTTQSEDVGGDGDGETTEPEPTEPEVPTEPTTTTVYMAGTYTISGNQLKMSVTTYKMNDVDTEWKQDETTTKFVVNGDKLTIGEGEQPQVYNRKK